MKTKGNKMATEAPKPKVLLTPKFRVAFPQVWHKKAFKEGDAGRYSLTAMFEPAQFTENDKAKWKALMEACNQVALKEWKKAYKVAKEDGGYTLPFHRGDEQRKWGRGPEIVYCTLAAVLRRPKIIDIHNVELTEDGDNEFYAGCYARASVNPYVPKGWRKTMAIGLNNLQKLGEGERLDAFSSAEDDFGSDPAEYAGAEDDDLMGAGDEFGA
jgi:hypothetical protein